MKTIFDLPLPIELIRIIYEEYLQTYKFRENEFVKQITTEMKIPLWYIPIQRISKDNICWTNSITLFPYNGVDNVELKIIKQIETRNRCKNCLQRKNDTIITYSFCKIIGMNTIRDYNLFVSK
jgi:hypothetical protein